MLIFIINNKKISCLYKKFSDIATAISLNKFISYL